jgi:hypothetical protein
MKKIAELVKFPALLRRRAAWLRARTIRRTLALAVILLIGVSGLRALPVQAATGSTVVSQSVVAGPYTLNLRIGPSVQLWTSQQARTTKPKNGEIILRGTAANGTMPNRHLDLHVALRTLGKVITDVPVAITVNTPGGKAVQNVPIATMQGVGKGSSDIHFGNNISLQPGRYHVVVQVKRTTTTFDVTLVK